MLPEHVLEESNGGVHRTMFVCVGVPRSQRSANVRSGFDSMQSVSAVVKMYFLLRRLSVTENQAYVQIGAANEGCRCRIRQLAAVQGDYAFFQNGAHTPT